MKNKKQNKPDRWKVLSIFLIILLIMTLFFFIETRIRFLRYTKVYNYEMLKDFKTNITLTIYQNCIDSHCDWFGCEKETRKDFIKDRCDKIITGGNLTAG